MGEKKMVTTTLTKEMIEDGVLLIKKLEQNNIQPDVVFWHYFAEIEQWKLVLVEVKINSDGPRAIYKKIQDTLISNANIIKHISLEDITITKPDVPIVALLRLAVRTGPEISGIRVTNTVINGIVINDAYIYRILPKGKRPAAGKFELKKTNDGQFMFNLKGSKGQVIITSELYKTRASAENGIESVRKNSLRPGAFEIRNNAKGDPYFVLKATNGQEIGRSEYYSLTEKLESSIEETKNCAPDAKIVDLAN